MIGAIIVVFQGLDLLVTHAELLLKRDILILCLVQRLRKNVLVLPHRLVELLCLFNLALELLILALQLCDDSNLKLALLDHLEESSIAFLQLLVECFDFLILIAHQIGQVGHLA